MERHDSFIRFRCLWIITLVLGYLLQINLNMFYFHKRGNGLDKKSPIYVLSLEEIVFNRSKIFLFIYKGGTRQSPQQ